ncbi:hypothetical protein K239x_15710 [Planctomycetes bacterium K23_9]|uniref:Uncharacterized protein n=1 Tax=Stieleria marina TaxID=1930275 RepID=A0A517NR77_9BACT|nr:hypothetical protein K239x_15710 [Planctomycetes bacterium K23_9]
MESPEGARDFPYSGCNKHRSNSQSPLLRGHFNKAIRQRQSEGRAGQGRSLKDLQSDRGRQLRSVAQIVGRRRYTDLQWDIVDSDTADRDRLVSGQLIDL